MEITRNNYELYALDFIDGALSPAEVAAFMAFLADNPDIANEVELLRETPPVAQASTTNIDFSNLKKDLNCTVVNENNFDEICIAYYENDLNEAGKGALLKWIETHPAYKRKFELFAQLKLKPDHGIVFFDKSELRQGKTLLLPHRRVTTAALLLAASVLLLFALNILKKQPAETFIISDVEEKPVEKIELPGDIEQTTVGVIKEKRVHKKNTLPEIPVQPKLNELRLAAVDTSDPQEFQFIRISGIETKVIEHEPLVADLIFKKNRQKTPAPVHKPLKPEMIRERSNHLIAKAANLSFEDVVRSGINGLNQIAETDLELKTKTDDRGRVTEFALRSDNFNIHRKLRN